MHHLIFRFHASSLSAHVAAHFLASDAASYSVFPKTKTGGGVSICRGGALRHVETRFPESKDV
jgi:hypothetical protein